MRWISFPYDSYHKWNWCFLPYALVISRLLVLLPREIFTEDLDQVDVYCMEEV